MSLFAGLSTQNDTDIQQETDSLGGGGVLDSGAYEFEITMAYAQESRSGAMGVTFWFKNVENGQENRQTLYVTSGTEKGKKNYYEDKNGKKNYLPGFNQVNAICLLTLDKELAEVETETKSVKIYSFDAQGDVPTQVEVLTDLIGQRVIVGMVKQIVDKRAKNDQTGKYEPTGETREVNEIDKIFCAKDEAKFYTTAELRAKEPEPAFYEKWVEKNAGKVRDRSTGASGNAGTKGAPKPAGGGAAAKPKNSLFGGN